MKQTLKRVAIATNLSDTVDLARRLTDCIKWLRLGATGLPPAPIKRRIIASYIKHHGLRTFVETGTHLGETLAYVANDRSKKCISVELGDNYFAAANSRFSSYPNVHLIHGDSALVMPAIVNDLREPALFWLDGHYSGGTTARGGLETPISAELQAVLASPVCGHVILIDDARLFDGSHDYPHLDDLLRQVRLDGRFAVEVSADVIRLTPKEHTRQDLA